MTALFVALEFNQASGQPDDDQSITLFDNLDEVMDHASELTEQNREVGRRETYHVFELVEVEP